jgi:isopenicillin-N epimerase
MREHWYLDAGLTFLNHGSFGACPIAVLEEQSRWRRKLESSPVQFFAREFPRQLDLVRQKVAPFVGVQPSDVVFVSNATEAVNAVLRSLPIETGDELLTTNHAYGACANALRYVAERCRAKLVVAEVPFPIRERSEVVDAVLSRVTPKTRLALLDHVTSATGLVFPIQTLVRELRDHGVETLVDGAHAPGMVDLDIEAIGAGYYAANFHKWLCAPKGAGMLWVRRDLQSRIVPAVISHGYLAPKEQRFQDMFDWTGTKDPSAWLCIPQALRHMEDLVEGGWRAIRTHNRSLALFARDVLCRALGIEHPAPDDMIGALAAVPLVPGPMGQKPADGPLYQALVREGFEVLVVPSPSGARRVLRVSAQLYNTSDQYERLAEALVPLLEQEAEAAATGDAPSS